MIPEGWDDVPLGDLFDVKHGFAFPGEFFTDVPAYPILLTPGNFAIGGGFKAGKARTFSGDVSAEYVLRPGSLVLTMTDLSRDVDTLGLPALVPDGPVYLHNQRIGLVVPRSDQVWVRFLNYLLRTKGYRSHVIATATGSTVRHTSPSRIKSYRARVPGFDLQRAIAEVLEALDDKIAANTKLASTAEALAQAIYREATRGVEMVPMSSRLMPVLGGTPARSMIEFWDGDNLWISARDVTGAGQSVILDTEEKITDLAIASTKAKPLPAGSVILTARGTVGAVARLAESASFNQSCYGFVPGALPASVLYFAIRAATDHAKALAHGSVFDTITMKTFDHLSVPGLDADSLDVLEGAIRGLLDIVDASQKENRTLAATRDALLPQLMSGKLRVRDAERIVSEVA